jgi:hypothetical protein
MVTIAVSMIMKYVIIGSSGSFAGLTMSFLTSELALTVYVIKSLKVFRESGDTILGLYFKIVQSEQYLSDECRIPILTENRVRFGIFH